MSGCEPILTPTEEINDALIGKYRAIVIAEKQVDLSKLDGENRLVLMKITEGSLAAGGRGGGFGERRIVRLSAFQLRGGQWLRTFETERREILDMVEVPYYVSRIPFVLSDSSESMGYGVIDPQLVDEIRTKVFGS
jgi:hypothetical protein